jgi:hypothetical protein
MKIITLEEYKKMNEDFYNPFDEDDDKIKKPKKISDKSNPLQLRKESFNLSRVEWSKRPNGEYTVLSKTQFAKGEIIEICPTIILGEGALTVDRLKDLVFEIDKDKKEWALVLGYGSLYRHSKKPNVDYAFNKITKQMYFITKTFVKQNEELTINYGSDYWMERTAFNTMATPERTDKNQGMPIFGKIITKKDIDESEIQPNSEDIKNTNNIKNISSPKNKNNPVISGIPIIGSGQS